MVHTPIEAINSQSLVSPQPSIPFGEVLLSPEALSSSSRSFMYGLPGVSLHVMVVHLEAGCPGRLPTMLRPAEALCSALGGMTHPWPLLTLD